LMICGDDHPARCAQHRLRHNPLNHGLPLDVTQGLTGQTRALPAGWDDNDKRRCHEVGAASSSWLSESPKRLAWLGNMTGMSSRIG
jgi:hypothetical protein